MGLNIKRKNQSYDAYIGCHLKTKVGQAQWLKPVILVS
jgi:hypothetical protein